MSGEGVQCCPEDIVTGGAGGCNVALRSVLGGGGQCCPEDSVSGGGGNVALRTLLVGGAMLP